MAQNHMVTETKKLERREADYDHLRRASATRGLHVLA